MTSKIFLSFIFLISSCSSVDWNNLFSKKENTKKRNEELMKDFELKEDVFNKFKEKPIVKKKEVLAVKPQPLKQIKKITKIQKAKEVRKRVPKKELVILEPKKVEKGFSYSQADYPEQYKQLDRDSVKFWYDFKPIVLENEQSIFSVTYGGVSTGNITIETRESTVVGGEPVFHFHARMKTSSFYSYLYEVDDIADSYVKKSDFIPLKFSLIQRQSSQDIDDLQLFDIKKLEVYSFYKRVRGEKIKKRQKIKPLPHLFQDPISVLYFLRGMPMDKDKVYRIPFMNKGKAEVLEARFDAIEEIKTKIGVKQAYRVLVNSAHEGKTIKGGVMKFWFSADEQRIFLKFSAKIKIGSIVGRIQRYTKE